MDRQSGYVETRTVSPVADTTMAGATRMTQGQQLQSGGMLSQSRVTWGTIWGGTIIIVALFLLMETFTVWVGWVSLNSGSGGIAGTGSEWITWIVAMIAFFLGGLVATSMSSVRGSGATGINGLLVWGLTTALMVGAAMLGAGLVFGAVGATVSRILILQPGTTAGGNMAAFASGAQTAGFWAFITLITTAIAAIIGGWVGNSFDPLGYLDRNNRANRI